MTKDVMDAIKERRSVRKFTGQPIDEATLNKVVEAALWAPSAGNVQPWHFFVVHNQDTKNRLMAASLNQKSVGDAPVAIVICADLQMAGAKYGERGETLYALQDTACAVQNILLAATAFGLSTVWVGAFDEEQVQSILEVPSHIRPVAIIPIGIGEVEPSAPAKKPIEQVVKIIN